MFVLFVPDSLAGDRGEASTLDFNLRVSRDGVGVEEKKGTRYPFLDLQGASRHLAGNSAVARRCFRATPRIRLTFRNFP